ncbi:MULTISPECIES: TonB-dependent siderophore receptor [Glaesserella]|uniref:TonB-dependent siderophore receptor n=1 Tax=Glaesserella australis TaxID=2094024 RepID=A0A328BZ63_9PAST|nr:MULTISPECIES: TonB-dependent siderophore receptor [Glaesserella]AUI66973.1 TonB-dependent siderophore receptor [Glaesserella sp. 15-184]RAL18935.1 TonB-dependent siderophore receptor [Glaesserella australis]
MKKTFVYSTISQVVLLAIASNAMANQPANTETATLDEISVVGGSMYRMGEVPVHQAKSAVAVSREELDKQNITKADEIGRYQAGFTNQVFGEDSNTNWFRVRGAEVTQAVDGLPTFSYGFFTPYVNTFGLEAVEITKGADAMTFGAAQSGGLINYVSKRPHKDQIGKGEFKLNIGNNTQYGFAADYTGAMNNAETLRYRLVTSYGGKDGQWDNTKNETLYIAPSFEWDISDRTRLTVLTNYQQDKGVPSNNFLPAYGTLVPTPNGYIDRSTNLGDPVNDKERNRQYSIGYELNHDFANGLQLSSSYRYSHADNYHRGSYAFSSVASDYSVARGLIFNDGKAISHALDNHLTWNYQNDWLKNTLVVGTNYRHNKVDTMYDGMGFGRTTGSNIFNPSVGYGQVQDLSGATHRTIKARQLGFYLQNQSRFADKVVLGLGVRHDRAKQDEYTSTQSVKQNHTSYSGSLMYEAPFGLNPYVAYSESFSIPVGISGNETLYEPNTTRQYEVGVKYLPTWLDGVITIAGFRAKDKGALKINQSGVSTQDDLVRRKGIEVQADVNITPNWSTTLAYTYLKAETDTASGKVRRQYIPTATFAAKTAYRFDQGMLNGLTLGAGIRYVGHSVATKDDTYNPYSHAQVPSTTVVDLMARYDFNQNWSAQVNVENVGDRRYVAACDYYCYYGAGRNINAQVSYKF